MKGTKRFRIKITGFSKSDVISYIEKLIEDFNEKIRKKDQEEERLKRHIKELKEKIDKLSETKISEDEEKFQIAGVLIDAKIKAEEIINEAKRIADEEKLKVMYEIENEQKMLYETKDKLQKLREVSEETLRLIGNDLEKVLDA